MKVLLATDGSDCSNVAVEELAKRAFPLNTQVHIVSAFESPVLILSAPLSANNMAPTYTDAEVMARKPAEEAVAKAVKLLQELNLKLSVTTAVIEGSPKHVILNEADSFDADLIIVGSHGHSAVGRFLLGSVSQSIALHAKCSVEIVRKHS